MSPFENIYQKTFMIKCRNVLESRVTGTFRKILWWYFCLRMKLIFLEMIRKINTGHIQQFFAKAFFQKLTSKISCLKVLSKKLTPHSIIESLFRPMNKKCLGQKMRSSVFRLSLVPINLTVVIRSTAGKTGLTLTFWLSRSRIITL